MQGIRLSRHDTMSCNNPSPLRYPGGKYKISRLIELLIDKTQQKCDTYIEPFAGGAGVAVDLLLRGVVERIVINDSDRAIYSIWKAIVGANAAFLDKLYATPVTIEEWKRQRSIYQTSKKYSLEYGFAAFFLNRTNHSGILGSGPIGGRAQNEWKLDVRYSVNELAAKILAIGQLRSQIKVYGRDVFSFIKNQLPRISQNSFLYFDPPYYRRGKVLYKNFFTNRLHRELCETIKSSVHRPWIVSYDDVPEIDHIYRGFVKRKFSLTYSLANNGTGREVMFFSEKGLVPTRRELRNISMEHYFYADKPTIDFGEEE